MGCYELTPFRQVSRWRESSPAVPPGAYLSCLATNIGNRFNALSIAA
jgi:hypothetical protein